MHTASGPRCFCPNPKDCEPGCARNPCQHGGSCHPQHQPPYYTCRCPTPFWGRHCELYTVPTSTPPATCLSQYCADKARDGICDEACNSHACQWDGGDCSLTMEDPWANCTSSLRCWEYINNQCDELCNTAECLFDNFECQRTSKTCKYEPRAFGLRACAERAVTNPLSLLSSLLTTPGLRPPAATSASRRVPAPAPSHAAALFLLADRGPGLLTA